MNIPPVGKRPRRISPQLQKSHESHSDDIKNALELAAKPAKRRKNDEFVMQTHFFSWRERFQGKYPVLSYIHSSLNGVYLHPKTRNDAKAAGMTKGVWDVFVPFRNVRPLEGVTYAGLYIEFKTSTGQPTLEQKAFRAMVAPQGYHFIICRSWDAGANAVAEWLDISSGIQGCDWGKFLEYKE
jgi:hypothetical protein